MVEIKVDTLKNSKEDLRKVIEFLTKFVEANPVSDINVSDGAFNLFDSPQEPKDNDNVKVKLY